MKTTKVLLLLSLFMACFATAQAQKDKCKFDVEKKDAFTGKEYKSVAIDVMATQEKQNNRYTWEFIKNDTLLSVTISRRFAKGLTDVIPAGQEFLLKQAGGFIMHLIITDEVTPELNSTGTTVASTYKIPVRIGKDDLKKLSLKAITNLKFNVGKLEVQGELSGAEAEKIQQVCKCLLQ